MLFFVLDDWVVWSGAVSVVCVHDCVCGEQQPEGVCARYRRMRQGLVPLLNSWRQANPACFQRWPDGWLMSPSVRTQSESWLCICMHDFWPRGVGPECARTFVRLALMC